MVLEVFHPREEDTVRVSREALRTTVAALFERMDVSSEDALLGADVLVSADLRGVDSHGVSNMLRSYITGYGNGRLNPRPAWRVVLVPGQPEAEEEAQRLANGIPLHKEVVEWFRTICTELSVPNLL